MLLRFSVENFRSFKSRQDFHLTAVKTCKEWLADNTGEDAGVRAVRTAVLYGANASGKSNLFLAMVRMKSFMLASVDIDKKANFLLCEPFLFDAEAVNKPETFELEFTIGDRHFTYGFSLLPRGTDPADYEIVEEWLLETEKRSPHPLFLRQRRINADGKTENVISVNADRMPDGRGLETRTRADVLFFTVAAQFAEPICQMISEYLRKSFNIFSGTEHAKLNDYSRVRFLADPNMALRIKKLIADADTGVKDIAIGDNGAMVSSHSMYNASGRDIGQVNVAFDLIESQGTQKLFNLSGALIDTLRNGSILAIDEFDEAFHPLLVRRLVELFNDSGTNPRNAQLVFSSQCPDLLGYRVVAVSGTRRLARLRRDQFYFVEKDNVGASKLLSLVEFKGQDGTRTRNDASFEKEYLAGSYGGIPFPASLFEGGA